MRIILQRERLLEQGMRACEYVTARLSFLLRNTPHSTAFTPFEPKISSFNVVSPTIVLFLNLKSNTPSPLKERFEVAPSLWSIDLGRVELDDILPTGGGDGS